MVSLKSQDVVIIEEVFSPPKPSSDVEVRVGKREELSESPHTFRRIHEVAQQVSFWDPSIVVSHCMQTYVNVAKLWVKWWKSS